MDDCPLYPYRFGHNPKRKGVGNIKSSAGFLIKAKERAKAKADGGSSGNTQLTAGLSPKKP